MRLLIIGGSDAGIEAARRARELDPTVEATVVPDARENGFDPLTVPSVQYDHKAYYPGAHQLYLRLTGDRRTGRLLGAQLLGDHRGEVAKRIDIPAGALFHGMTVDQLCDLDLSYTPPFGSPWDAIQLAAQTWTRS